MKIKDVIKLTGLTAKSIRYYESKGLLTVERNEDNSYRDYSENEVNRLRFIKLLRYLDFSIGEIAEILNKDDVGLKGVLREKAETFASQKNICETKQEICLALAKDYDSNPQVIDEYNEAVEFLESDDMAETVEKLKDYACPNLTTTIVQTLIFIAPVLWLFININAGKQDMLMVNAICAVIGTVLVTANWIHYAVQYRRYKNRVRKNNRKWAWMGPMIIISAVVGIVAIIAIMMLAVKIMAPDEYLFSEYHQVAGIAMIWLIMIPVILVCVMLAAKIGRKNLEEMEDVNDIIFIWNHLGKIRPVVIVVWLIGMYCCITSVTYVTEDSIIYHSPINPGGIIYKYSDVESVTTGFGDKTFSFIEYKRKGNFFYQIELDGRIITFHVPSSNEDIERYEKDSYLELEEFDQALVRLGISKKADDSGYENCDLDKRCVERFLRIIELE